MAADMAVALERERDEAIEARNALPVMSEDAAWDRIEQEVGAEGVEPLKALIERLQAGLFNAAELAEVKLPDALAASSTPPRHSSSPPTLSAASWRSRRDREAIMRTLEDGPRRARRAAWRAAARARVADARGIGVGDSSARPATPRAESREGLV
jgi:hypothetical protein